MKVIKSGNCIMGIVGTPTPMKDLMGKDLFVGDLVRLFFISDGLEESGGLTYIADDNFNTFYDGTVSCDGVSRPFVMGIKSCALGEVKAHGGYWHVKKVNRYNLKKVRFGKNTPHTIEEIDNLTSFFKKDF